MTQPHDYPVIVIGGSLVGLSAALFLSHWKVPVVVLERHPSSALHPRAVGYTARTIEFLKTVGASDDLKGIMWKGGPPKRIVVESLSGKWENEVAWTEKKPTSAPPTDRKEEKRGPPEGPHSGPSYSHVQGVAVAQDIIEPVLRAHAIRLGAELRLGHKVVDWTQDEEGVTVTATSPDGTEYSLRGQYLVACDGARSLVREKLGIARQGVGIIRALRSILFKCPRIDKYLDRGYSQFQIENQDFEAFMTTYGNGRWMLAWNDGTADFDDPETRLDLIQKATGLSDLTGDDVEFITTGQWDIGGLVADEYSAGRVFIAGDAAHALPPNRAGFGANTGIADVHNLAWKLSSVLQGKSRPELLDTYSQERQPIAVVRHDQIFARQDYRRFVNGQEWPGKDAAILDDDALEFGQIHHSDGILGADENLPLAKVPTEWKAQPGTRAAHVSLRKGGEAISTLDLFGTEWVVISSDGEWKQSVDSAARKLGVTVQFACIGKELVEEVEGSFDEIYGLNKTGAALVRPDGIVAWKVIERSEDHLKALTDALSKVSYAVKGGE